MFKYPFKSYESDDGRKFFVFMSPVSVQCAACLSVQSHKLERDEKGVVINITVSPEYEQHAGGCPQSVENK